MNHEELTGFVEQAEKHNAQGNYIQAGKSAEQGLADVDLERVPELLTRALIAMSESLWQRGMAHEALPHLEKALILTRQEQYKALEAKALGNMGNIYFNLSDYARSLEYYKAALGANEEIGNKTGIASDTSNIGIVYGDLLDYPRALEYFQSALAHYKGLGSKRGISRNLSNIGNVYMMTSDHGKALEYFYEALMINEEISNKSGMANNTGNIGVVYAQISDYSSALQYFQTALALYEELGNLRSVARYTGNIGKVYAQKSFDAYDPNKAEEHLKKALEQSESLGAKKVLYEFQKSLADLYEHQERWEEFAVCFKNFYKLEKEVQNEKAKKQAERFDYERKQAERDKQLATERAETKARIDEQQKLIYNILPTSIADRLLNNETFIADSYPNVSVLFMDLVSFTRIASIVPPRHLIYLLTHLTQNFKELIKFVILTTQPRRHNAGQRIIRPLHRFSDKLVWSDIGDGYVDDAQRLSFARLNYAVALKR